MFCTFSALKPHAGSGAIKIGPAKFLLPEVIKGVPHEGMDCSLSFVFRAYVVFCFLVLLVLVLV